MFDFILRRPPRREHFRDPFFLQWHITDRCNLNCLHCYRDEIKKDLSPSQLSMILEQFTDLLAYLGKKGRIQFAGGEPLLSEHLFEMVERARQKEIPSRILSNGTIINDRIISNICKTNVRGVQISIDGTKATHDSIRGEGNFDKAIKGAERLRAAGVEVTFNVTVSKLNINELEAIAEIARQHADRLSYHRLIPYGKGRELQDQLIDPAGVKEYFDLIAQKIKHSCEKLEVVYRDPLWRPYLTPGARCRIISGCSVAYNGICVESNGDVYPCRRLPVVIGNVLKDSLVDLWNCDIMNALRNRNKLKGKCSKCSLKWHCGGCRALAYALTKDFLAEDVQCFKS